MYLSADELRHIMTNYGETLPQEEVEEMLAVAGVNEEGKIDYMSKYNSIFRNVKKKKTKGPDVQSMINKVVYIAVKRHLLPSHEKCLLP